MINEKKFKKLKQTTQIFKICGELEILRENILSGKITDTSSLSQYAHFISDTDKSTSNRLLSLLKEKDKRALLERVHFLLHELREEAGYPISEKQFLKRSEDNHKYSGTKNDLIIILENLRSAFNVGSIIRSSECFSIKKIISTGITPQLEDNKVLKTTKGTESNVKFEYSKNIKSTIKELIDQGYTVLGAETGEGSKTLNDHNFEEKTALILGNEEIGITQETLGLCDDIIEIELTGLKNSLNVSNAAAVLMFEYVRQVRSCESRVLGPELSKN